MGLLERYKKLFLTRAPAPQNIPARRLAEPAKVIEIRVAVPSWDRLPFYKKAVSLLAHIPLSNRTKGIIIAGLAVLVFYTYNLTIHQKSSSAPSVLASPHLERGTPPYPTVLPAGKKIEELGGWTRISPPDRNPVYTYTDKVDNIMINVSEQPLPKSLKTNTAEQIEQLANSFNATGKITVGGTVVHIGTSENGPQSVIFNKNDLLILIKSSARLDNNQWAEYINSLR
jgi:hypothetical protein